MEEEYMSQAIGLAKKGIGFVNPNPLVGSLVVKEGKVIGEGYHEKFGGPHAEVNALAHAGEQARGGTLYVTLEPCCHYGKTPPCTEKIIQSGLTRVIVGMKDPNPRVSGKGIQRLREAGIEVIVGVLEEECRELNRKFIHYMTTGMPYVLYKSAMSMDGKTATARGESQWISCQESRDKVQLLRQEYASVMVGSGTLFQDQPRLTCRLESGRNPVRVLLDTKLQIKEDHPALRQNGADIILVTGNQISERPDFLQREDVELLPMPVTNGRLPMKNVIKALGERQIDSVLFEGGATLAGELLKENLIQEILFFYAPILMGDQEAFGPFRGMGLEHLKDAWGLDCVKVTSSGTDLMVSGRLKGDNRCLQV